MRLTLRTLLAYMDDILDPADHEELTRKIEASDFATELIHRSRDASRRLRLGAPDPAAGDGGDLHGGNDFDDANTMAEYLDNTLSPEAVAEFERACLARGDKGDMLLAEAVSAHHVLAMVLREPAEVDQDLRQRIYRLAGADAQPAQSLRIEPAHAMPGAEPETPSAPPAPAAPVAAAEPSAQPKAAATVAAAPDHHDLPDYLRVAAETRRKKRRLMYTAIAAMIAGGLVVFLWPWKDQEPPSEVAKIDANEAANAEIETGAGDIGAIGASDSPLPAESGGEAPAFVPTPPPADEPGDDSDAAPTVDEEPDGSAAAAAPVFDEPLRNEVGDDELPPAMAPGGDDEPPVEPGPEMNDEVGDDEFDVPGPLGELPPDNPLPGDEAPEMVDDDPAAAAAIPGGPLMPDELGGALDAPTGDTPPPIPSGESLPMARGDDDAADPLDADDEPVAVDPDRPLGTYLGMMGVNDILLAYGGDLGQWVRLPPRTPLGDEANLLVPPTFRTMVNLQDANIYLGGGTELHVMRAANLPGDPPVDMTLEVPRGRMVINAGLNGNRIELVAGDQSRIFQLEPSSTLAVEVSAEFRPGVDPQPGGAPRTIAWFLTSGSGQFNLNGASEQRMAPAQWITADGADQPTAAMDELPAWIDHEVVTAVQRTAQKRVAPELRRGAPVNIALLELSDPDGAGRQREVRTLAAQVAAYVDLFEPMVKALGDTDQKAYWKRLIETTRQTLAEDPRAAAALQDALVSRRGERDAAELMAMIIGYSSDDIGATDEAIQAGPVAGLLRNLDHDDLDFRVLAFHNLCELTGTAGFGYRPERTADQRARTLRVIWKRFDDGDLLPQQKTGP